MKRTLSVITQLLTLFTVAVGLLTGRAQTTATWNGSGGDGEWNNGLNWDQTLPPGDGTNAIIGTGNTVNYSSPMVAGNFGNLTLGGVLNVNASGFVLASNGVAVLLNAATSRLFVNSGGAMSVTNGSVTFQAVSAGSLSSGGSLAIQSQLNMGAGTTGFFTNNGGTLSAATTRINPNNLASSCFLQINGGINDLGNVSIFRSSSGSAAFNGLGTEGLVISNGLVRMTGLLVGAPGANSSLTMQVAGGIVTNSGNFISGQVTGANSRPSRFIQHGGLVVSTIADGIRVGVSNTTQIAQFVVLGGTNMAERYVLGDATNGAVSVVVNFTNAANIYVGSGGIVSNVVNTLNAALNSGGTFGANADWTGSVPMVLNGTPGTFNAADLGGTAHNITINGVIRGAGSLNKTGAGTLTLNAANTFSGNSTIANGILALGAAGSISSPQVIINSTGVFDVSQVAGYTLASARTIAGSGSVTGNVAQAANSIVNPTAATLTFANDLTESGSAINHLDLSGSPSAVTNDFINVLGTLNLSATNTIEVTGTLAPASVYPLIQYGTLNGGTTNFLVSGSTGTLSNSPVTKTIYLVTGAAIRAPTNIVWVGSATVNDWDVLNRTNWLNAGVLDYFVTSDSVLFDDTGVSHPLVNLPVTVSPSSVTVDSTGNYTLAGSGQISGIGGLTKTNSGTLTISTTNSYSGPTIISGGTLEATTIGNGGVFSSIGAAPVNPTNLVIDGGTFRYTGATAATDRGASVGAGGGVIDVTTGGTTLTENGTVTGSGTLVKQGPGTLVLNVDSTHAGGTVISNGTLRINSGGGLGSAGMTNNGATFRLNTTTSVGNVVEFNGVTTLDLGNVGGNAALDGSWSGNGVVNIINQQNPTRVFTMGGNGAGGGNMNNFSGTVNIGTNSGTFRFNDGGGSPSLGSSNMVLDLGTGTAIFYNRNRGTANQLGALLGGSGTLLTNGTDSSGTTTYTIGGRNTDFTFGGNINSASGAPIAVTKVGTGTMTLTGPNGYTGATAISNGVLALSGSGALPRTASILVVSNVTLDVSARSDGTLTLTNQSLRGGGTVRGSVTAQNGSSVSVGDTDFVPSALTISNALILQAGSSVTMEVDQNQGFGALTNDVIQGLTSVTYAGTLNVTILSIETNSVFKLFAANSYSGAFDAISPAAPGIASKYAWDTSYLAVDGTLRITFLRPRITAISISGSDIVLDGTDAIAGSDYYVLSSTNVLLPVSQWTRLSTNSIGFTGFQLTLTGEFDPASPQRFYLLQLAQ